MHNTATNSEGRERERAVPNGPKVRERESIAKKLFSGRAANAGRGSDSVQ